MFDDSKTLADKIAELCDDVKAENINTYDVKETSQIADYYIICSGNSNPHLRAIRDKVENELASKGLEPKTVDSAPGSKWTIMDYSNVILHIFHPDTRAYYNIEELWQAKALTPENLRWDCPDSQILIEGQEEYTRPDANEWF